MAPSCMGAGVLACRFLSSLIFSILIFLRPTAQREASAVRAWCNEGIYTLSRIWPQEEGKTPHLLYVSRQRPSVSKGVCFGSAPLACQYRAALGPSLTL